MEKGGMEEARNRTAVLLDRIKRAWKGELNVDFPQHQPLPGDWYCPKCNDLQFARNIECRKCGFRNSTSQPDGPKDPEVEVFLEKYTIEEHARIQFRNLQPDLQKL